MPRSVVSACQAKWSDAIGPHGWDGDLDRYELSPIPNGGDLAKAELVMRAAMAPPQGRVIKAELARLRATTISRAAEQSDLALSFAAYAESFAEYPADIVINTCRYWSRNEKWWPALAELRERMDRKFRRRRLLAQAIAEAAERASRHKPSAAE